MDSAINKIKYKTHSEWNREFSAIKNNKTKEYSNDEIIF